MKGNLMVRMMTVMILISMLLAHLTGQVDLLSPTWLWLGVFASFMGLQATFTGFCPSNLIGKLSKTGDCCPGGACSTSAKPEEKDATKATTGCCGGASDKAANTQSEACCSGSDDDVKKANAGNADNMVIKVLGTGCANCKNTEKLIKATAEELAVQVEVIKVEDIAEIAKYGIMSTPGVVINEEVVHSGGIPSKAVVSGWFK